MPFSTGAWSLSARADFRERVKKGPEPDFSSKRIMRQHRFLTDLKDAVRDRRPFNPRTGLPEAETTGRLGQRGEHLKAAPVAGSGST